MKRLLAITLSMLLAMAMSSFAQTSSGAFCENFDDGTGFQSRWTRWYGTQQAVTSPTHSDGGAVRLYGAGSACGSSMYRSGFQESYGEYSAWVRQEYYNAEPRLYVMVDPNSSADPVYRQSYMILLSASNSEYPNLRCWRVEGPNNQGQLLGSKSSVSFALNEWVQAFVRILPGGTIVAGYRKTNGTGDSLFCTDAQPINRTGLFLLYTCGASPSPSNVYDDACFTPVNQLPATQAFCDNLDDGSGWLSRWTPFHSTPIPTIVNSPTHSDGQAVRFQTCWPAMYRTGLEAVAGYYSGWVYQTNSYQQGAEFVIQSDFDGNNWLGSRHYDLSFSSLGTPGGGTMTITRRENNAQTSYASKPVTFQRNEWVQIFIDRRLPDTVIAGYQRTTGFRDSILYVDPNPLMTPGKFIIMSCGQDANNAYIWDDICYSPTTTQPPSNAPFCDNFEGGQLNVQPLNWERIYGRQLVVNSPVNGTSTRSIKFEGYDNGCHSIMKYANFVAGPGEYSCWFQQQRSASTGLRIYACVQPGGQAHPDYRDGYVAAFNASNSSNGGFLFVAKQDYTTGQHFNNQVASNFVTGEWIRAFLRVTESGQIVAGYEKGGSVYTTAISDPSPLGTGGFYVGSCVDGTSPANFVDDVCYQAVPSVPPANYSEAEFGNSHCFNGNDDYISVPNAALNNLSSGTVEAWVKFKTLDSPGSGEQFIMIRAKHPNNVDYIGDLRLAKEQSTGVNANKFYFSLDNGVTRLYSSTVATVDTWYHVAGTWNGSQWHIFVNGIDQGSTNRTTVLPNDPAMEVRLGRGYGASLQYEAPFNGEMDEVRISRVVRSPYEFALSAPSLPDGNAMALWHLDEGGSSPIVDATAQGNTGTAFGTTCGPLLLGSKIRIVRVTGYSCTSGNPVFAGTASRVQVEIYNEGDSPSPTRNVNVKVQAIDLCNVPPRSLSCLFGGSSRIAEEFQFYNVALPSIPAGYSQMLEMAPIVFTRPYFTDEICVALSSTNGPLDEITLSTTKEACQSFIVNPNPNSGLNCAVTLLSTALTIATSVGPSDYGSFSSWLTSVDTPVPQLNMYLSAGSVAPTAEFMINNSAAISSYSVAFRAGLFTWLNGGCDPDLFIANVGIFAKSFLVGMASDQVLKAQLKAAPSVHLTLSIIILKSMFQEAISGQSGCIHFVFEQLPTILASFASTVTNSLDQLVGNIIALKCPAELQLINATSDTTRVSSNRGCVSESNSAVAATFEDLKVIMFVDNGNSNTIRIVGEDNGWATLTIGQPLRHGVPLLITYDSIPLRLGSIASLYNYGPTSRSYAFEIDLDGDGVVDETHLPKSTSDSGKISIFCDSQTSLPMIGLKIDVYDAADILVDTLVTDENGHCETHRVMLGEYTLALNLPLGFVCNEPIKTVVLAEGSATANLEVTKLNITPQQRSRDYWAGQLTKVLQNRPASFTKAQFSRFAGLISQHFNDNLLNSVATYVVPQPANQNDSLVMMRKLLTFGCTEVNEPFLKKVAKGELVALMLNVAAGKVSQTHVVTQDGATLSQAITYCDMLINEVDCPIGDVPSWFMPGYPNRLEVLRYLKACFTGGLINVGVTLPSGQIPLDIMNIAYKELASSPIPTDFELSQNHPNPFNPMTTIRFAIPQAENVQLDILNIIGQRVRTLVDEVRPAGTHEVQWDGRDNNGNAVSSGVYLYRIKAGEFTETKKMVLMK